MSDIIKRILEDGEQIVWEGKQDFKSAMLSGFVGSLALFVFGAIFYIGSSTNEGTCTVNGLVRPMQECSSVFQYVVYAVIALAILTPVFWYVQYRVTRYAITDKRALIKSGFIGADMRSVYYEQMRSAFVEVGVIGKMFTTGSILIDTGRMTQSKEGEKTLYDRFSNIKDPYGVYKLLQDRISNRKEGLESGRADYESNKKEYKDYIQDTERMKKQA